MIIIKAQDKEGRATIVGRVYEDDEEAEARRFAKRAVANNPNLRRIKLVSKKGNVRLAEFHRGLLGKIVEVTR